MLKRLTTAAIGVVGLVVIGLGIASATVWRADDVLVATTSGGSHTLVTDPGVLELGGDPVTVKVSVPDGGPVVLAVGRDTDVAGWVGSDAHGQVTGLTGWHTLAVDDVAAPAPTAAPTDAVPTEPAPADAATPAPTEGTTDAPATVADPTGSDLWVAEVTGEGSAELVWPAQEGRWSLLAVSTGESAPTLAMEWPRVVTTPWLWPCVAVGTLLVLVAAWLLLRDVRRRRAGLDEPRWHPVSTGATPVVVGGNVDTIPVLTRRQMREAAQGHVARPRTGSVPQVAAPASAPAPAAPAAPAEPLRAPVPTGAAATNPSVAGTSRRALRPPTGAIPVTQASPAASGWTPPAPSAPAPSTSGAYAPGASTTSAYAPGASPSGRTPGTPPPAPGGPSGAPAGPARPGVAPGGRPFGGPGGPGGQGVPGGPSTAPGAADRPTDQAAPAPHGRPSWVRGTAGPPPTAAPGGGPSPVTGPERSGPAGWSAVPPPPGARVRPGSPAGPDSSVHAGRPTWVRPTAQEPPSADDAATAGSRADAWRRAWGLPPTEGAPDADHAETDTRGEQR